MGNGKEERVGSAVGGDLTERKEEHEEIVAVIEEKLWFGGGAPAMHPLPQRRHSRGHRVATHRSSRHRRRRRRRRGRRRRRLGIRV